MATLDTLQDAVDVLTASTTSLLTEVNVNKSTLTTSATSASNSATNAAASANTATTQASNASASATAASNSAADAASSALAASAISLANEPLRHSVTPSLLLDFANSESLDPRITFARASTATYYGTRTALAEQNLVLQSQTFDNASWTKTNGTITADAVAAPDGTSTADLFTENTATAEHNLLPVGASSIANVPMVFSVYIKPNGRTVVRLDWANSGGFAVTATLTGSGTINSGTGTVTALADGWYRLALTITPTSAVATFRIKLCESVGVTSYTGDGTSGIYLWGAQLEQRSVATAYTVTTTQPITNYTPVLETAASGVARFDNNPTTFESLGLLIEEQRTNLLTYSEQFDNAAWTKSNATVTANAIVSPDGTLDADKLVEGTTTSIKYVRQTGAASGQTFSVYAKAGGRNFISIGSTNSGGLWGVSQFNLSTGIFVNSVSVGGEAAPTSPTITSVGNGWYRVSVVIAGSSTNAVIMVTNGGDPVFEGYTGNGFDGIYIWGAQIEAGAFPTSYIPTVASQVTRAADAASMTGTNFSSWFNNAEGSICFEYNSAKPSANSYGAFVISDNTSNNRMMHVGNTSTTRQDFAVTASNVSQASIAYLATSTVGAYIKASATYKFNDFVASGNGAAVVADTSGTIPVVNRIDFGHFFPGTPASNTLNGTIKKLAYYPKRLSNAELQSLTS